jgi:hypothetical protein
LVFGVIEGPHLGWASPAIIAVFAVALAAFLGFHFCEPRVRGPVLDLRFFHGIPFSAANLIAVFSFAARGAFLYLNSIYLQDARGYSALHTGLLMVPLAIVSVFRGPRNGKILARFGSRVPLIIAGISRALAGAILTPVTVTTSILWLLVADALMGLDSSSVGAPITHTAVVGMPPDQAGVAAGVSSTTRQIGQTIGVAGVLLASATTNTHAQLAAATHPDLDLERRIWPGSLAVLGLGLIATTAHAKQTAETALPTNASMPISSGAG